MRLGHKALLMGGLLVVVTTGVVLGPRVLRRVKARLRGGAASHGVVAAAFERPRALAQPPAPRLASGALAVWVAPDGVKVLPDGTLPRAPGGGAGAFAQSFPDYRNQSAAWSADQRQARVAALRGRRLVVSYHTASDLLAPVAAAMVGAVALSSRRDMGFTKKPIHVRAQRQINKLVAGMTVVSAAVKGAVEASEGFPAERLHVIHNGIDATRHARDVAARARVRAEFGFADDDIVIGTLANFDPIKGYDVLLPAAEAVCRALPRVRFLLCGRGPLHADSLQRIERAGLAQRILMPGARRDVPAVLQALDLFVLASHSEGFSNALLEGMAAGLPVLATDVGGNRALIQPELTGSEREVGVLCAPGDSAAVERGLLSLAGPSPEAAARRARMLSLIHI